MTDALAVPEAKAPDRVSGTPSMLENALSARATGAGASSISAIYPGHCTANTPSGTDSATSCPPANASRCAVGT